MKNRLTKTAYLSYLKCPQEFWLAVHEPLLVAEPDTLEYEHLRQQGYAVEQFVRKLEQFQPNDDTTAVDFQRAFQTADLYARSDVVVTDKTTGVIDIYEIKARRRSKKSITTTWRFKRWSPKAGSTVGRCHVITMNGEYVRNGDIDPEQLFVITDVTDKVDERMDVTDRQTNEAIAYLDGSPVPALVDYCMENKLDCRFIRLHFPDLPDYTVFDIAFLKHDKRRELLSNGIIAITDVPDDFPLSAKQRHTGRGGKIRRDPDRSRRDRQAHRRVGIPAPFPRLRNVFLRHSAVRRRQARFSRCVSNTRCIHARRARRRAKTFLFSLARRGPIRRVLWPRACKEDMSGGIGTVFVWYEAFEKTRNTEMAGMFPEFAAFFEEVNAHTYDLMKIFSDNLYIHPDFKGRSSIKKVLPVLVPDLSYLDLGIGDGMTASISWFRAATWDTMDDADATKDLHRPGNILSIRYSRHGRDLQQTRRSLFPEGAFLEWDNFIPRLP